MSDEKEVVYLIQHEHGYIKIGRSTNPKQRVATLETATPYELTVIGAIDASDPVETERRLHDKYEDQCKSGEWFSLDAHDKQHLLALCDLNADQVTARYGRTEEQRRENTLRYQGLIG
jgi:hypothetical protein